MTRSGTSSFEAWDRRVTRIAERALPENQRVFLLGPGGTELGVIRDGVSRDQALRLHDRHGRLMQLAFELGADAWAVNPEFSAEE